MPDGVPAAPNSTQRRIAAVDLGSNSFHMIIAGVDAQGNVRILDKLRESVRLRGGLDADNQLSEVVKQRALDCLQRFGERIHDFAAADVAAVGTNTLRQASRARRFLDQAEQALGHRISIISGNEEARLIYLGVSHTLIEREEIQRFVMDIGGGSTELILGQGFRANHLESLNMGCVSSSQRYFPEGRLDADCWQQAITAARLELQPIQQRYRRIGWETATGASGTIKSVLKMIRQCGLSPYTIIPAHLRTLQQRMQAAGHISQLAIPGLSDERKPVIAGGLAILLSTFEALGIREMQVSEGALREGLVYDRIDQIQHGDLHEKTVAALQSRFHIDTEHAGRVRETAEQLFDASSQAWRLEAGLRNLLGWAASLHEAGLAISHSAHHKHGAYLMKYLDLSGFSSEEQECLSVLVRAHRRKLSERLFDELESKRFDKVMYLAVLLRLAVLIQRSRSKSAPRLQDFQVNGRAITLVFAA
ncbi:MAG: exopolyphosphatase, partial [Thiolinea sp.]